MTLRGTAAALLLGLIAGLGCEKRPTATGNQADTADARAAVDSIMLAHFQAFQRGDIARWSGILAEDAFLTSAGPTDVFFSRDSVRRRMTLDIGRLRQGGIQLTINPLIHSTWVAAHGRTAATTYDLDYRVNYQDQSISYRLRSSYLLERDTSGWTVLAAQYSRAVAYDTLFMALVRRSIPGAARLGDQASPSASEIVEQFRSDIRNISIATLAENATVVSPGTIVQGAQSGRQELNQWLGPAGTTETGDGIRAGMDASSTVGWVASNLYVPVYSGPESAMAPMRALFVYCRAGDQWKIVQASLSVGLREGS